MSDHLSLVFAGNMKERLVENLDAIVDGGTYSTLPSGHQFRVECKTGQLLQ